MLFLHTVSWLGSLLFTILWLPTVSATGLAGAYERIGPIYQTYRIAVDTWGAGQRKILPGLADIEGSHPKGGANFMEMINFLDYKPSEYLKDEWYKSRELDVNDPDPHKTAYEMDYHGRTNLMKLELIFEGEESIWDSVVAKIRTVLKTAHDEMANKGKLGEIAHYRDRLKTCHVAILKLRQSDMAGGNNGKRALAKAIKDKWKGANVVVNTEIWEHDQQVRIFSISTQKTVETSPAGLFTLKEVEDFVENYGTNDKDKSTAKNHYRVIQEYQATVEMEKRFKARPEC